MRTNRDSQDFGHGKNDGEDGSNYARNQAKERHLL